MTRPRVIEAAVLAHVRDQPGCGFRDLMRAGIPRERLWPALDALESSGHLTVIRVRRRLHLHAGMVPRKTARDASLRRDPRLALLAAWLTTAKPRSQKAVLDEAETWGWARSTTQYRLQRLGYKFRKPRKRQRGVPPRPRGRVYALAPAARRIMAGLLAEPHEAAGHRYRAPASQGP